MKELDLYKFVLDNHVEYHWHDDDVIMFVNLDNLKEFCDLLGWRAFDEEGIGCVLKDKYISLWMKDICENNGISLENVFTNKEN